MQDGEDSGSRVASVVDLETLVSLATAFRDHIGLSAPLEADWRTSIVRLLQDRDTEFLVAWSACGGHKSGICAVPLPLLSVDDGAGGRD